MEVEPPLSPLASLPAGHVRRLCSLAALSSGRSRRTSAVRVRFSCSPAARWLRLLMKRVVHARWPRFPMAQVVRIRRSHPSFVRGVLASVRRGFRVQMFHVKHFRSTDALLRVETYGRIPSLCTRIVAAIKKRLQLGEAAAALESDDLVQRRIRTRGTCPSGRSRSGTCRSPRPCGCNRRSGRGSRCRRRQRRCCCTPPDNARHARTRQAWRG